jgi:hypothetical protein
MTTTTETALTRAEVIRRFKAARSYTVTSRTFGGVEKMPETHGIGARVIERVTSTGVYIVGGPRYALTTFEKGAEWSEDGDELIMRTFRTDRQTGERVEDARVSYLLEVSE